MEEPDNFKTFSQYNQFIEYQQKLYDILSLPIVSVLLTDGKTVKIKPETHRPISQLAYQFWILLVIAGVVFYIGL